MHPFPPPPPFWHTPGGAILTYLALLALVMGTLGRILLREKHKAGPRDVVIWCMAGVTLSIVFVSLSAGVREVRDIMHAAIFLLWAAVVFASWWSWLRMHDKDDAMQTVVSVAAVVAMGLLLVPCLLPAVGGGESPQRTQCKDNLHNIGLALHNYHEVTDSLPAQVTGQPPVSWRVNVLPYLGHEGLHNRYDMAAAWNSANNLSIARRTIPEYTCPSVRDGYQQRDGLLFTSYAVAVGNHTLWQGDRPMKLDFGSDGTSQTLLVVEACGQQIVWTEPRDMELSATPIGVNLPGDADGQSAGAISSYHAGGAHVLLADGAVRFMNAKTHPEILDALLTADGGEEVGSF